jgi:hypothetical protein
MPLFDAYGRPLPAGSTKIDKRPEEELPPKPERQSTAGLAFFFRALRPGWELLVSVAGIAGLALALYAVRPVLTVALLTPPDNSPAYYAKFSVTNSGHTAIHDVKVLCFANKAVFAFKYTFVLNDLVTLSMDSAPTIDPGETWFVECTQPYFLYFNSQDGFLTFGSMSPPKHEVPMMDFHFYNGTPRLNHPNSIAHGWVDNIAPYTSYPLSGVDASLVFNYKVIGIKRSRSIHIVGGQDAGPFAWKIEPASKETIPDGEGGFKFVSYGINLTLKSKGWQRPAVGP